MADQVKESMASVSKDLGPSIGDQSTVVEGWWRQMAEIYNSNIHHSFVRDIPTSIVTQFLVDKGVVQDEFNAQRLYSHDLGEGGVGQGCCKTDHVLENNQFLKTSMSWEEFMQIFSKRMFRDALLQITKQINKIGAKSAKNYDP
jgi:hypothetical protein